MDPPRSAWRCAQLLGDPALVGRARHTHVDHAPRSVFHQDEGKQGSEPRIVELQKVIGRREAPRKWDSPRSYWCGSLTTRGNLVAPATHAAYLVAHTATTIHHRSAGVSRGRAIWRRNTRICCRSRAFSATNGPPRRAASPAVDK